MNTSDCKRFSARALLAAALILVAGCGALPQTGFYQLQQEALVAEGVQHSDVAALLGPVKIADYLQREQILQREAAGRLTASREGRWAGSLQDDIGQLLLRQLAAQLNSSHIALYPDRVGVKQQTQVVLSIGRLDSGVEHPAVLEAQWRLLDGKGNVRDSRVVHLEQAHKGDLASQIQAQGQLLVQLSVQLAEAVKAAQTKPARVSARGKSTPRTTTASANEATKVPAMPLAEPLTEAEVYRF